MSKEIDEKVVSMQFDNRNFEKNVNTTMSTLDKLKSKLKFDGASKGLDNIDKAAKKVDFSSMSNSVETLRVKFSALDVVGVTAITRITNSMMNFASKTLSFLTNGIIQGGINRAMNIENARFQLDGLLKDETAVAAVMQNVKDSVDGTAYSLDAAATVASQLAASGMKAGDKMYKSLLGVAGVAAMTNSEYSEIGRIYTQVAGQGRLMGDQLLQLSGRGMNAAATLGQALGKTEAEIRDMVSKGKIDFDTFAMAMYDAFGTQAKKANDTFTGSLANIKSALARIGEAFVSPLIVSNGPMVHLFNAIRVKVNEFKDAVVPVAEKVSGKVASVIEMLSNAIKGESVDVGGTTGWDTLSKKITDAGIPLEKFQNEFSKVAKKNGIDMDGLIKKSGSFGKALTEIKNPGKIAIQTLQNISKEYKNTAQSQEKLQEKLKRFQEVVDKVWNGDYKNQPFRADLLKKAGYDYAEVQALVNKTVDQHRLTLQDLSETQLKSIGYTEDEIKAVKELVAEAEKTGTPINELIQNMGKLSKGQLLFETLSNTIQPIVTILKSFKEALNGAFTLSNGNNLYAILDSLHSFSETLVMSDDAADKLTRTFKGLFAAIDIITNIAGGGFRFAFQIALKVIEEISKALGFANYSFLSVTAAIGDAIVKIRDWYKEHNIVNKLIEATVPIIIKLLGVFSALIEKILEIPKVQEIISNVSNAIDGFCTGISDFFDLVSNSLDSFIESIKSVDVSKLSFDGITKMFDKIPSNVIKGLVKGFADGGKDVIQSIVKLASDLVDAFCERLGIHSPSTVFIDLAKYCIQGLTVGFGTGIAPIITLINKIIDFITSPFDKINFDTMSKRLDDLGKVIVKVKDAVVDFVTSIQWDKISAVLMSGALLWILKQLVDVLESIVSPLESVSNVLNGFTKVLSGFASIESAYAKNLKAKAYKEIAEAIGILALAIAGLSRIDTGKLWSVIGAIGALATILGLLSFAVSKMELDGGEFAKFALFVVSLGVSMKLMASAIKTIGNMDTGKAIQGLGGLTTIFILLSGLMYAYGKLVKGDAAANIDKAGTTILKVSASLIILATAIKLMGLLKVDDIQNGIMVMGVFAGFMAVLAIITNKWGKNINKLGSLVVKVSASLMLFSLAIKLMGILSLDDLLHGIEVMSVFVVFIGALTAVTTIAGEDKIAKVGGIIMAASAAMILLAVATKIMGSMDMDAFGKGLLGVTYLGTLMTAFLVVCNSLGSEAPKAAMNMLAMSVSIGILAGISVLLSLIDLEGLAKGITAVGMLGAIVALMVYATKGAKDVKGTIMMLSVAIATMAVAVAALSFVDTKKLAGATAALGSLMLAFSLMTLAFSTIGKGMTSGIVALTATVAILSMLLYSLCDLPIDKALPIALAMSTLMISLSVSCAILAGVGVLGQAAFVGVGALLTLITSVGLLMAGLGGLVEQLPQAETFLKKGIKVLSLIGKGLGEFFGNIVGGFLDGVLGSLPDIGTKLSDFWTNSETFFNGIKGIGSDTIDSVKNLTQALLLLTAADFVQKISSWLTGDLDMESFSTALTSLGKGLSSFAGETASIDSKSVKKASEAVKYLAEASDDIPKVNGLMQSITGMTDIEGFGKNLKSLGSGLKEFAKETVDIDAKAVKSAAKALNNLVTSTKDMPKIDGLAQVITGVTDIKDFGSKLKSLGSGLKEFAKETVDINSDSIKGASEALNTLVAIKIPAQDGLWQKLKGESNLGKLGDNLKSLGTGLAGFYESVKDVGIKKINSAVNAVDSMVDIAKRLTKIDFDGNEIYTLCDSMGDAILSLVDSVKGTKSKTIDTVKNKILKIKEVIESLAGIDTSGVKPYTKALKSLGEISTSSIVSSMNNSKPLVTNATNGIFTSIANAAKSQTPVVAGSFKSNITNSINVINGTASMFGSVGLTLISKLSSGILSGSGSVSSSVSGVARAGKSAIDGYYNSFYNSGVSLSEGFSRGINSMTNAIINVASRVASAAANALHTTLKINSPSKVTRKDGKSFGEGFILGIKDRTKEVAAKATDMATQAVSGLEDGFRYVKDIALDDITYKPMISPILDLADVRSGFDQMDMLFASRRSLEMANSINVVSEQQTLRETVDTAVQSVLDKMNQNGTEGTDQTYTIEVPLNVDGKQMAKATAKYTQEEITRMQRINDRRRGKV